MTKRDNIINLQDYAEGKNVQVIGGGSALPKPKMPEDAYEAYEQAEEEPRRQRTETRKRQPKAALGLSVKLKIDRFAVMAYLETVAVNLYCSMQMYIVSGLVRYFLPLGVLFFGTLMFYLWTSGREIDGCGSSGMPKLYMRALFREWARKRITAGIAFAVGITCLIGFSLVRIFLYLNPWGEDFRRNLVLGLMLISALLAVGLLYAARWLVDCRRYLRRLERRQRRFM